MTNIHLSLFVAAIFSLYVLTIKAKSLIVYSYGHRKFHAKLFKYNIYVSKMPMRTRQKRDRSNGNAGKLYELKKKLYREHEGKCEECGRIIDLHDAELHHVLPYSKFQDLMLLPQNTQILCNKCHKNIHLNVFLYCRQIRWKADELGIDLTEVYGDIAEETI